MIRSRRNVTAASRVTSRVSVDESITEPQEQQKHPQSVEGMIDSNEEWSWHRDFVRMVPVVWSLWRGAHLLWRSSAPNWSIRQATTGTPSDRTMISIIVRSTTQHQQVIRCCRMACWTAIVTSQFRGGVKYVCVCKVNLAAHPCFLPEQPRRTTKCHTHLGNVIEQNGSKVHNLITTISLCPSERKPLWWVSVQNRLLSKIKWTATCRFLYTGFALPQRFRCVTLVWRSCRIHNHIQHNWEQNVQQMDRWGKKEDKS